MLKEERFEIILKQLKVSNKVTFEELAKELLVSEDTVRRDIEILYKNGLLSKVRGGAILREKDPLSFSDRQTFLSDEKNIIALKAQQFIKDGMTVFMDGGTTVGKVISYMPIGIELRIITHNLSLIPLLQGYKNVELIILGGQFDFDLAINTGAITCNEASKYIADVFILSTCAIDENFGISSTSVKDLETKTAMLNSSKKIITLAHQNKLRRTEAFKVCNVNDITVLITELPADSPELNSLRDLGIQII